MFLLWFNPITVGIAIGTGAGAKHGNTDLIVTVIGIVTAIVIAISRDAGANSTANGGYRDRD